MSKEYIKVVHGNKKVLVKNPTKKDLNDSNVIYNKAWRKGLEDKLILRKRLSEHLVEQGLWSEEKQKEYEKFATDINTREILLKKGGIPLKKAKAIALEIKKIRNDFRELITERSSYDSNTVEGVADNARFDYLVSVCILDPDTKQPVFKNLDDYEKRGNEDWAVKAASQLANLLYGLDPNYEDNLEENKFLKRFKFVDEKGRYVNKDGHLIDIDEDGVERLIDEEGYFVAYDENGEQYFVNRSGEKVEHKERDEKIVEAPFLDDDGNPITENGEVLETEETVKKTKKKKADPE